MKKEPTRESSARQICLVGCTYSGPPNGLSPLIGQVFARFREVQPEGIARQLQYATGTTPQDYTHFIGVEVEQISRIPEGMVAWSIEGQLWRVCHDCAGELVAESCEQIQWNWFDQSTPRRPCGEFSTRAPARHFRIVSNSYLGAPGCDEIRLVDYDPGWPDRFQEMKEHLLTLLGTDVAQRVEHYGSTSIPGMAAKPVIDILVQIPSWETGRRCAIPALNMPHGEFWFYNDHMCFIIRDALTGLRTHHIHMAPQGHRIWEGLAFRDHLRTHPQSAARYLELKRHLARLHGNDREAYTNAKEAFVREIGDVMRAL